MQTLESIPCPNCTTEEALERHPNLSGFWTTYPDENVKRCNNCKHEEPYYPQSSRDGNEHGTTKSQEKKLDRIRDHAEKRCHEDWELEEKHLEWGPMSLTLKLDPDASLIGVRFHIILSRRGKVEVKSASDRLGGDMDPNVKMLCRATNGHDDRREYTSDDTADVGDDTADVDADPGEQIALF